MTGPFDPEPLWSDENFTVVKGVLDAKVSVSGTTLGRGVIYYPGLRTVIHRIVGAEAAEEAILAQTQRNLRCLWNPGQSIEIVNESEQAADLFRVEVNYSPQLADVFSRDTAAAATAQLLHGDWPKSFQASVKKDLQAIGSLATLLARRQILSSDDIQRATRAKEDLEFKLAWFAGSFRRSGLARYSLWRVGVFGAEERSAISPGDGMIKVTVNTQDANGRAVKGCEVLANAWPDGEDPRTAGSFPQLSTPTTNRLPVGKYAMWAEKGKRKGVTRGIEIGNTQEPSDRAQTVDLIAP